MSWSPWGGKFTILRETGEGEIPAEQESKLPLLYYGSGRRETSDFFKKFFSRRGLYLEGGWRSKGKNPHYVIMVQPAKKVRPFFKKFLEAEIWPRERLNNRDFLQIPVKQENPYYGIVDHSAKKVWPFPKKFFSRRKLVSRKVKNGDCRRLLLKATLNVLERGTYDFSVAV